MKKEKAESQDLRVTHIWIPFPSLPFNFSVTVGK